MADAGVPDDLHTEIVPRRSHLYTSDVPPAAAKRFLHEDAGAIVVFDYKASNKTLDRTPNVKMFRPLNHLFQTPTAKSHQIARSTHQEQKLSFESGFRPQRTT